MTGSFEVIATKYIPRLQNDLSLTRTQACGIFGNIGGETGGFSSLQEKNPTIKDSKGGYGWLQWTGPRRRSYERWCKTNNLDYTTDESNYRYLIEESKTTERHSVEQLKKTTTLEAATETFMKLNLRPGVPHLTTRLTYARRAYDATNTVNLSTSTKVGTGAVITTAGALSAAPHYWPYIVTAFGIAICLFVSLKYYQYRNTTK